MPVHRTVLRKKIVKEEFWSFYHIRTSSYFFSIFVRHFLRGFQSCILCFHQNVLKKKNLFLKKILGFFNLFGYCVNNFWPPAMKIPLDLSKLASTRPMVHSEAKNFFLKIVQFWKQARTLNNKTSFFVGKFSAGLAKLHFMFLSEHSKKSKNFLRKKFFLYFLNLGWRICGFPLEKTVRLSKMQCTCP